MKSKLKFLLMTIVLLSLFLVGCGKVQENDGGMDKEGPGYEEVVNSNEVSTPNRKIIYKVEADINTSNLKEDVNSIKKLIEEDEWLDQETISSTRAYLVIRIKSERLEHFLSSLKSSYEVSNYNKTATDISLTYQDKSNLLLTYQKERERLLELYEEASLSDMITINSRLAEIDIEIYKLQGELNQFDSLVDYSEVKLTMYALEEDNEVASFGERIKSGFSSGLKALIIFLDTIVIILATLTPWLIVIVPIVVGSYLFLNYNRKKQKNNEKSKNDKN